MCQRVGLVWLRKPVRALGIISGSVFNNLSHTDKVTKEKTLTSIWVMRLVLQSPSLLQFTPWRPILHPTSHNNAQKIHHPHQHLHHQDHRRHLHHHHIRQKYLVRSLQHFKKDIKIRLPGLSDQVN